MRVSNGGAPLVHASLEGDELGPRCTYHSKGGPAWMTASGPEQDLAQSSVDGGDLSVHLGLSLEEAVVADDFCMPFFDHGLVARCVSGGTSTGFLRRVWFVPTLVLDL